MRIWVDTINLNVCEGREFDSLGVWFESFIRDSEEEEADHYVGFRQQDSIFSMTLTLQWDTSRIRLQPPYIITTPQTLFGRFPAKTQSVDTNEGTLYVSVSADQTLRTVIGRNIPLFYLKGRVRAEDTVDMPEAGARVQFMDMEGVLRENLGTVDFVPGFVRVIRDTTPEYTGSVRVTEGDLDTNRLDTLFVIAENFADRRVNEFQFSLLADTNAFKFVDTLETGTMSTAGVWSSKHVHLQADSIYLQYTANADLTIEDSLVIGIIVERTTDSSFNATLEVAEFGVNANSCLGKLNTFRGEVGGEKIPKIDTTTTVVWEDWKSQRSGTEVVDVKVVQEGGNARIILRNVVAEDILLYDVAGRGIGQWDAGEGKDDLEIQLPTELTTGTYFLLVRDKNRRIWYKQIFIQTN